MDAPSLLNIKAFPFTDEMVKAFKVQKDLHLETLFQASALAGAFPQKVQAGAADLIVAFNNHFRDAGGIEEESTLHADPIAGDTPNSESAIVGIPADV